MRLTYTSIAEELTGIFVQQASWASLTSNGKDSLKNGNSKNGNDHVITCVSWAHFATRSPLNRLFEYEIRIVLGFNPLLWIIISKFLHTEEVSHLKVKSAKPEITIPISDDNSLLTVFYYKIAFEIILQKIQVSFKRNEIIKMVLN